MDSGSNSNPSSSSGSRSRPRNNSHTHNNNNNPRRHDYPPKPAHTFLTPSPASLSSLSPPATSGQSPPSPNINKKPNSATSTPGPPKPKPPHEPLLDTRLYHNLNPNTPHNTSRPRLRLCLLTHPYPPLGGSFNDPIVLSIATHLLNSTSTSCPVSTLLTTFNFRGASRSTPARTTWTSLGEQTDLRAVLGALLAVASGYFHGSCIDNAKKTKPGESKKEGEEPVHSFLQQEENNNNHKKEEEEEQHPEIELLLAGYSYGSLVLSRLPPLYHVLVRIQDHITSYPTSGYTKCLRACRDYGWYLGVGKRGGKADAGGNVGGGGVSGGGFPFQGSCYNDKTTLDILSLYPGLIPKYILISPLLPPLSNLLSLSLPSISLPAFSLKKSIASGFGIFGKLWSNIDNKNNNSSSSYNSNKGSQDQKHHGSTDLLSCCLQDEKEEEEEEEEKDILVVYGDSDVFTAVEKYRGWRRRWMREEEEREGEGEGEVSTTRKKSKKKKKVVEIEGAGHFWIEDGSLDKMLGAVGEWVV